MRKYNLTPVENIEKEREFLTLGMPVTVIDVTTGKEVKAVICNKELGEYDFDYEVKGLPGKVKADTYAILENGEMISIMVSSEGIVAGCTGEFDSIDSTQLQKSKNAAMKRLALSGIESLDHLVTILGGKVETQKAEEVTEEATESTGSPAETQTPATEAPATDTPTASTPAETQTPETQTPEAQTPEAQTPKTTDKEKKPGKEKVAKEKKEKKEKPAKEQGPSRADQVLELIKSNPRISTKEIQQTLNINYAYLIRVMGDLRKKGLIESKTQDK